MPIAYDSAGEVGEAGISDSGGAGTEAGITETGVDVGACTPGAKFCESGAVRTCASDGRSSFVFETCSSSQYCDPVGAFCAARVCVPGRALCNNQTATTCNVDGSQYVQGGTDCRLTGRTCSKGACVGEVRLCSPEQPVCADNSATTCNSDGSGYGASRTDCTVAGLACWVGECKAIVVDATTSPGPSADMASGVALLNIYSVDTSRTLLRIGAELRVPSRAAGTTLTWLVYESPTKTNASYRLVSSTTTTATAFEAEVASGPLSIPLEAGHFYLVGVSWQGNYIGYSYILPADSAAIATSFGSLISGTAVQPGEQPGWRELPAACYLQRLTTAP